MKHRVAALLFLLAASPSTAGAQPAGPQLGDKELLGMRLFNQSCRVCHTQPQATSPAQYSTGQGL